MPAYVWKGKTRDGKAISGERVADSKEAVMAMLRRDQILVSSVKEKGKEVAVPKIGGSVPAKERHGVHERRRHRVDPEHRRIPWPLGIRRDRPP